MSNELKDTTDARHALNSEALEVAAQKIKDGHKEVMSLKDQARAHIIQTSTAALKVAVIVEQVHAQLKGPRFAEWWREQDLPVGFAPKYLTIARTSKSQSLDDKTQLRLIGILPEPQGGNPGQRRPYNPFAWTKWAGKIKKNLEAIDLDDLDEADAKSHLDHLRPIKEIIERLERRTR